MRGSVNVLNAKVSCQALLIGLSSEFVVLLMWSTHRIDKARDIALGYLNRVDCVIPVIGICHLGSSHYLAQCV